MIKVLKRRIKTFIRRPRRALELAARSDLFNLLSDKIFLKLMYYASTGKKLNLVNPKTYNEKLQWLKLYDRRPEQTIYVDKFAVREYVKNTIGKQYLIPLIGVYDNFDEIDFSKYPDQFVLKCTHDSGGLVICKDKNKFDMKSVKKKINKSMKYNFFYYGREWPYKNVKPRIICEKYLQENIIDYKFMCFNGVPKLIQVHQNRDTQHTLDFYDLNWNRTEIRRNRNTASSLIPRPKQFDEMLSIVKKLSKDEIHVRIDLYEVDGRVYFGEKTYYSSSGFSPFKKDEYDELLGSWIELPKIQSY